MKKKEYPCDSGDFICPFGGNESGRMYFCRDNCGLGVDESCVEAEFDNDDNAETDDDDSCENELDVIALLEIVRNLVEDLEEHECENVDIYIQQLALAGYKYEHLKFEPLYDKNAKTDHVPCYLSSYYGDRRVIYKCNMCGCLMVVRYDNISAEYPEDYSLDCTVCGNWEEVGDMRPHSFEVVHEWRVESGQE